MTVKIDTLPQEVQDYIKGLEQQVSSIEQEKDQWKVKYELAMQRLELALHKIFGSSSERIIDNGKQLQMRFVDEAEQETELPENPQESTEVEKIEVQNHSRKKPRKAIPEGLPEIILYHDIADEDKMCACNHKRHLVKTIETKKLGYRPELFYVEKHIRLIYGCKNCEGSGDEEKPALLVAPKEKSIIPKSIATPSLLAGIFTNKYCDHLPFYRQAQRFFRTGIQISRQDMSNWNLNVYEPVIKPLVKLVNEHILASDFLQMDETFMRVMNEAEKPNTSKSYAWVARGGPPDKPAVTFTYKDSRSHTHPTDFLNGFKGFVQTDGYAAYDTAVKNQDDIHLVGCFAHCRRMFYDTWIASKKKSERAEIGINFIKQICSVEAELREKNLQGADFLNERKIKVQPILDKFYTWCETEYPKTPPDSDLGKAFGYTLKQWNKLINYLNHPRITPTNNLAENAIRPFVIGRKNWLLNGSSEGAEASCGLISLIETAKMNNVNPYIYLNYIFTEIPRMKNSDKISDFLPMNINHEKLKEFAANQIPNRLV